MYWFHVPVVHVCPAGTVKFGERRAKALTEEQQADFVLGALEGTARRAVRLLGERQRQSITLLWKELEERYGWLTPLPIAQNRFFHCRQQPRMSLFDYQLDLRELYSRLCKQEPGGEEEDDDLLRDQFLLGLHDGPWKQ
ncbi:hypothetical protein SKAU_G00353370 [Synaphobranchus kaupii]|uniref:Retrotransposon gag domain-containing protein n=1 Tax=Synaphobranchus kaupii TaxID=118154 RepID=A0A9Q1EKZ6_SYNKA|nr:hypothetical protein SKAU_G00353370 [Synaphobranchus kaupii]